jgi:hypothetical protein
MIKIPKFCKYGYLGEAFETVLNTWQAEVAFIPFMSQSEDSAFPFTEEEVEGFIANLKDKKATSPDGLYSEHLKGFQRSAINHMD